MAGRRSVDAMKRINPIYLLLAFNLAFFVIRSQLPEGAFEQFSAEIGRVAEALGVGGYVGFVAVYSACAFFFIPLLIPLNVICGAVYGPYVGTAVSWLGITSGCVASTISVRHVFTGIQGTIGKRAAAQQLLRQIEHHGTVVVLMVRLAFVVPYMFQNIVLALTAIRLPRLVALTAVGSLPGAAIYCFVGAGLVQSRDVGQLAFYFAVPLLLLVAIGLAVRYLNSRYRD
jgi:uncharacterized membrane protein YdjX (TVP38/TMEM64 family)